MIHINLGATMRCEEDGCEAQAPARLVLLAGGGFAFQPGAPGWQIGIPSGPQPFKTNCPKHTKQVLAASTLPTLPKVINGR